MCHEDLCSPSFIYVGKFEDDHVYTYHLQLFMYLRYLDDIFLIWQHSLEELHKFVDHLNSRTDSITFTVEFSNEVVHFLDTTVNLNDRILYASQWTHAVAYCLTLPTPLIVRILTVWLCPPLSLRKVYLPQATHKGTKHFNIQVLNLISLPKNS